ncbi:hypothetical protein [Aureimonas sp. Leaf454]|nr:hypothetical protein [Aureimonas sp. Leaf454]
MNPSRISSSIRPGTRHGACALSIVQPARVAGRDRTARRTAA